MITRVIKQLQLALHKPNVFYLSGSDKFKNKGKPERSGFFGKNKNKEENKQISQSHITQKHQNKSLKSQHFLHKKQKAETDSQPQKIHQNRKQAQTKKIEQPQRVEEIPLKLRKTQAEKPKIQSQVQPQSNGQSMSQLLNKVNKARESGQLFQSLEREPEVTQKKLYTHVAFQQFVEASEQILKLFDNKQWQTLQNRLELLESDEMPAETIVNTIHPLFINRQPVKYAQWISSKNRFSARLSHKILRIVFNNLVNNNQFEVAKNFIKVLQNRGVDIGYEFMDSIFNSIDKNASLSTLRATLPSKIQFALFTLDSISNSTPTEPKYQERSWKAQKGYMVGTWFANLWFIAKERHLFMPEFIQIFEYLTIKQKNKINLAQIHANGLFLDVIENYYFGSHIGSIKLNTLFSHIFNRNDFHVLILSFRNILMQYKVKTGKAPFPMIDNFYQQLKQSLLLSQYNRALFYFQLCSVQGHQEPFKVFEDNPQLIKTISFQTNIDVLKEGLLCTSKDNLKSQPKKSRGEKKQHHKQKVIKNSKAASIQQFLNRKNSRQTVPYMVGAMGLNREFIDILANRDQTQLSSSDINMDRLRAINQKLFQNQDDEYYLSQNENENDEYGQIMDANEQIKKKMRKINKLFASEQNQDQKESQSSELQNQQNKEQSSEELSISEDQQQIKLKQSQTKDGEPYVLGYEDDSDLSYDQHPYVRNMNQLYNNQLKNQCHNEKNFLRKELFKVVRLSSNPLHSVKAAIKLGKPQYAWTIFKHKIMKLYIQERMWKNIDYVIRAFVLEHSQNNHQYDIHQIMDSLHRFKYEFLDKYDRDGTKNLKDDYILKHTSFAQSIYERLENFDQLIWEHLPQGKLKHQFWQSTLVLQRAQELLKLQAQGKLQNLQYEREHYEIQSNKVSQIFPKQLSWRDQLIYGLGIAAPEQVPIRSSENNPSLYLKFEDQSEFKDYILNPLTQKYSPSVKLRTAQQYTQIQGQVAEGEEAVAEGEEAAEAVEGEEAQAAEGEEVQAIQGEQGQVVKGEQLQAAQGQQQVAAETQEGSQVQQQTVASIQQVQAQQEVEQAQVIPEQQTANATDTYEGQELMVKNKSIFAYSQENKIKGYDFQAFMQINKLKLKPFFQKQYQQNEKQFKKYFLALEALVQEAYLYDNHSLQKKLIDVQSYIKDSFTIAKMTSFGLWNFDFVTVQQPFQYLQRSHEFIQNFFTFKKYMGDKLPEDVPNLRKQRIQNFNEIVHNRRVTHQLVEQLLIKRHHLFKEAEAIVRLDANEAVDDIILWGLYNDQPLAIYMGQKLAMLTNQKIPHKLALLVARYLSHRRDVPQSRVQRCKQALKIVGRINREHIYELSKDYQHITVRKHLRSFIEKRREDLDSSALQHLSRVEPTYATQDTTFNLRNKISRGNLTV